MFGWNSGLKGKRALVTAASKGLGKASALALAEEGARVLICARGEDALRKAEAEIAAVGAEVVAVQEDVTRPEAPARLVEATIEAFGGIDVLVGNSGGPPPGRALDVDDAQIEAAVNANMTTSIRLVRAAHPHMRAAGWGRLCLDHVQHGEAADPDPGVVQPRAGRPLGVGEDGGRRHVRGRRHAEPRVPGIPRNRPRERTSGSEVTGSRWETRTTSGRWSRSSAPEPAGFVSGTAVLVDGARSLGLL